MSNPDPFTNDLFHPGGNLLLERLNKPAAAALKEAVQFARQTRWDSIRSPHIFMGLLAAPDQGIRNWGARLGANLDELLRQFQEFFHQEQGDPEAALALHREFLSDNVLRLLRHAQQRAGDHGRPAITPLDLLITLLTATNSIVAHCFEQLGGITAARLTELAVMAEQEADPD
jgi:ATP-dependent Clp protease ATP-binding subunit ClpA